MSGEFHPGPSLSPHVGPPVEDWVSDLGEESESCKGGWSRLGPLAPDEEPPERIII